MSAQPSSLSAAYTCALCRQTFSTGVPIIGEGIEERTKRIFEKLSEHIRTRHQNEAGQVSAIAASLAIWLALQHFSHNDAGLQGFAAQIRVGVLMMLNQKQEAPSITDEMIAAKVDEFLKLEGAARDTAIRMMIEMREVLSRTSVQHRPGPGE
jgi:hypothetical protein